MARARPGKSMTMEALKNAILSRLDLPRVHEGKTIEVVATAMGLRDLDQARLNLLADALASRAQEGMAEAGAKPMGIFAANVDFSDDGECRDTEGHPANAAVVGQRCYRLILQIVID
jgi:hypothetical protein